MMPLLSRIDKMILKEILSPNENKSSASMSRKLEISMTTLQRRRKRLEKEFLEEDYTFLLKKFGWRRVVSLFQPVMEKLMCWQIIFFH
jgi:DNA-binding Lrp family transcriptional regulator